MRRPKAAHFLCPHLPKPPRLGAVGRLVRPLVGCRQLWSVAALPAPQLVLRPSYLAIARQCGSARPEPGKCPTEPESSIFQYVMNMAQDSTRKPYADRWMSNGELQRIASYLDRGRKFEDLLSNDLASWHMKDGSALVLISTATSISTQMTFPRNTLCERLTRHLNWCEVKLIA